MGKLTDPKYIKSLMQRHGVHFSKGLGQNFIIDPEICPEIAMQGGANNHTGALEIGAGVGVLTYELAQRCKKVVCVEIDAGLLPVLDETLADCPNAEIVNADVLKIDLHKLIAEKFAGMDVVVCANLPYYITSPILMHLLESRLPVNSITVMVQKEAAERICAKMPSRHSGAITAAVRYYSNPVQLFEVSREAFLPAPKVDSAVIRLDILDKPPVETPDEKLFFQVVKGSFSQRRKTILNCLSAFFGIDKAACTQMLDQAGISPTSRAEQLSITEFAAITTALYQKRKQDQ